MPCCSDVSGISMDGVLLFWSGPMCRLPYRGGSEEVERSGLACSFVFLMDETSQRRRHKHELKSPRAYSTKTLRPTLLPRFSKQRSMIKPVPRRRPKVPSPMMEPESESEHSSLWPMGTITPRSLSCDSWSTAGGTPPAPPSVQARSAEGSVHRIQPLFFGAVPERLLLPDDL